MQTDDYAWTGTHTGLPSPGWTMMESQVASAYATLDFETGLDSAYDTYVFKGSKILMNAGGEIPTWPTAP